MSDKVYQNEINKLLKLDCGEDITTATAQSISVRKPDGTSETWTATIVDSNYVQHATIAGDLNQAGTHLVQAVVTLDGVIRRGNTAEFYVYPQFG